MGAVFVVCAALGVTVLVLQFLLALVGLGGDAFGVDTPHDFGHDLSPAEHCFADHGFDAEDVHGELGHDAPPAGEHGGESGEHADEHHAGPVHHGSASFFRVLSLRTVVAALAFFGLAGLAAQSAECTPFNTLLIAAAAGLGAMYAVYAMLRAMQSVRAEGTVRIHRALGKEATVYLHIPANRQGAGKIQINLQNRTMEYLATTPGDAIPTGATVVVTEVFGSDTVGVRPVSANHVPLPNGEKSAI